MNMKPLKVCAAALVAVFAFAANAVTYPTLTWTGLAGDNQWMSAGNWTSGSGDPNPGGTNNFYFADVPDNTTITISAKTYINDLTVTNTTGSARKLTITSTQDIRNFSTGTFYIYPGCFLDFVCGALNPWIGTFNGFNLRGGGTLRFSKARESWGGNANVYASTFILNYSGGMNSGMGTIPLTLYGDAAVFQVACDTWVKNLYSETNKSPTFDLNGHFICNIVSQARTLGGLLTGASSSGLRLTGPFDFKIDRDSQMGGTYEVRNSKLYFGTSDTKSAAIPSGSTIDMYSNGRVYFYTNQTIGVLKGAGATAQINVPENRALTVNGNGTAESSYAGRLDGMGGFVKAGAGYTLTMSGDSTSFTGRTTVAEGTLKLERPIVYNDDIVLYWPFDGVSSNADVISGITWGQRDTYPMPTLASGDGVYGDAVRFEKAPAAPVEEIMLQISNYSTSGWRRKIDGTNFTVSVWLKPSADDNNGDGRNGYFFNYGGWPTETAKNLCLLRFYKKGATERIEGYDSNPSIDVSSTPLTDGNWHHVVYVHSLHRITFWIDGVNRGSWDSTGDLYISLGDTLQIGSKDGWGGGSAGSNYRGDLDELIVANGNWGEERILDEYNRVRPAEGPAALPTPAAKWTFDNGFVDEIGGVELVNIGTTTVAPETRAGAYGKCINLTDNARKLGIKEGNAYPFPTNNQNFTVSLRVNFFNADEYSHVFNFGDTYTANKYFAMGHISAGRYNDVNWAKVATRGADINMSDQVNQSEASVVAWEHVVATYDGTSVRAYRAGRLVSTAAATLNIANGPFYLGYYPNQVENKPKAGVYVDDFRIWTNCCFTADQVMALSRSLESGAFSGQLPESGVTVASGAKLKAVGAGNAVKALDGAGDFEIARDSSLTSGGGTFAGAISGGGRLTLTGAADLSGANAADFTGLIEVKSGVTALNSTFSGGRVVLDGGMVAGTANEVVVCEGMTIVQSGSTPLVPAVSTTGKLVLPHALTIALDGEKPGGIVVVASAGTLVAPDELSGWVPPNGYRVRVRDNKVILFPLGFLLLVN